MEDYALWLTEAIGIGIALLSMVVLVILLLWARRQRQRLRRAREAAEAAGWRWQQEDPTLVDAWPLVPFGIGEQRSAQHVVRGHHHGRGFVAFQYSYVDGERDDERRHDFAVYVLTLPGTLPVIQAGGKDTPVGQLTSALGFDDITAEGAGTDERWRFRTANQEFAAALLDERMRASFPDGETWSWGFAGDRMMATHPGRLDVSEVTSWLDRMAAVSDRIPDEVWRDYGKG